MHHRRGFNWLELVIVLVILTILVSILIPLIQRAREKAREVQCRNHLKQIGLAMHNYRDTYDRFPSGFIAANGWGYEAALLSFLDASPVLWDSYITGRMSVCGPENQTNRAFVVRSLPVYLCPSDRYPRSHDGQIINPKTAVETNCPGQRDAIGASNYVGVMGDREARCPDEPGTGVLWHNSSVRIKDITDGTANTVMVGERDGTRHIGSNWAGTSYDVTDPTRCKDPLFVVDYCDSSRWINGPYPHAFGSMHPGGAHFLYADGTVRFLNDGLDLDVYRKLANRMDETAEE